MDAKLQAGIEDEILDVKEQAAVAVNENNRIFYVGSTGNLKERVLAHVAPGAGSSGIKFTTDFSPRALVELVGCDSKTEATKLEADRAGLLDAREDSFAFSDQLDN